MAVTKFLALNFLGAVYVPINTGYRGDLLEHVVRASGASLMLADGTLIDRLGAVDALQLTTVMVLGDERPALEGIDLVSAEGPHTRALGTDSCRLRVVIDRFSVSRFWDTIRRFEIATVGPAARRRHARHLGSRDSRDHRPG